MCASAGNHAQGFAYACKALGVKGVVFMPTITPKQKVRQTQMWGEDAVEVRLVGDTFDDAAAEAARASAEHGFTPVPPFNDLRVVEGQGTVGLEILEDYPLASTSPSAAALLQAMIGGGKGGATTTTTTTSGRPAPDFVFLPVGGGGLAAGVGYAVGTASPSTKIIGVEPEGAPSMLAALRAGKPVRVDRIDPFVDGAAVKLVGAVPFPYVRASLAGMHLVPEGRVCTTCLRMYSEEGIVVEPAGALSIAALDDFAADIKGAEVVAIVSGSNNDIGRMAEIQERSLQHEGLKHYFLVNFAQRPGALKEFVTFVLGPQDDIVRFEYLRKHSKEAGPALVGIEVATRADYDVLKRNMKRYGVDSIEVSKDDKLYGYLV